MCDARPIAKGLKGQANRRRLENGANSVEKEEYERRMNGDVENASRAGGKGRKRIIANGKSALAWKRRDRPELVRVFGQLKRTGGPSTAYICRSYPADRSSLSKCRVFFPKAPRRSSPIDLALYVVSRKRLPDYVCPATDGDADERTSGLYIVPPDLKPP